MRMMSEHRARNRVNRRGPLDRQPAKKPTLTVLLWHVGAFAAINALLWIVDLNVGQEGTQWANWIALVWGIGLALHVAGYWARGRGLEDSKYTQNYSDVSKRWGGF